MYSVIKLYYYRPYPKPERKKACLEALRVIELKPGTLYPCTIYIRILYNVYAYLTFLHLTSTLTTASSGT